MAINSNNSSSCNIMATTTSSSIPIVLFLITSLLCLYPITLVHAQVLDEENPNVPPNKWFIETPVFRQEQLDLFLTYRVSDFVPYENLRFTLYDTLGCAGGDGGNDITDPEYNDYLSASLVEPQTAITTSGEGNAFWDVTMGITFNPETIRESPIIHEEDGLKTLLKFCVRLGAYSSTIVNPASVELFFKETAVTLEIRQEGDVETDDFVISPEDITDESAYQLYRLEGWLCNTTNHRLYDPIPIFAGMPTRVCVTPNEEARAAGVYMRAIDSFYWTRETIYQTAIISHQKAAPLTEIECEPGMRICAFTTILKARFFYQRGQVYGAGIGWLQFGRGDYTGEARRVEFVLFEDEGPLLASTKSGIGLLPSPSTRSDSDTWEFGDEGYAGAGPFQVDRPVTRLYNAIGWLCDKDDNALDPLKNPLVNGDKARVCVTPNSIALLDDVKIRSIDSYEWHREDYNVSQVAIISNANAAPRTEIFCVRGSLVCAFETLLNDEFYGSRPGLIEGTGIIWLQFGSDSRRLQFDLGFSLLPTMESGFAGASPFSAYVYTIPPPNLRELYTCRAHECDFDNREIINTIARTQGSSARMCVRPSAAAVEAGALMWSVEWWTWSQVNVNQTAVEPQGIEAADGRTLLMCERGMDVCVFQTRFIDDFFQLQTNGIQGDGHCWITFNGFRIRGEIEPPKPGDPPINPELDALYAGRNDIGIYFPVTGNYREIQSCPPEIHSLRIWWEEEDPTLKMVYIAAMIGAGAGLCCLFILCFCCNRRRNDEVYTEQAHGPIVVNVDVEDVQNTQEHVHREYEDHKEYNLKRHDAEETTNNSSESIKPTDEDVCFGDSRHPGTKECRDTLRKYIKKNPDESYGPDVYKAIRKKMSDRQLLTRNSPKSKWRRATKSEAISSIGEMWREEKYKK